MPAGEESVKRIHDIRPAGEIVADMMATARRLIEADLIAGTPYPS